MNFFLPFISFFTKCRTSSYIKSFAASLLQQHSSHMRGELWPADILSSTLQFVCLCWHGKNCMRLISTASLSYSPMMQPVLLPWRQTIRLLIAVVLTVCVGSISLQSLLFSTEIKPSWSDRCLWSETFIFAQSFCPFTRLWNIGRNWYFIQQY